MPIKYIQSSIVQMTNIIQTMQVEIEAKAEVIISSYEKKIQFLTEKLAKSSENSKLEEQKTVNALIQKNLQLSKRLYELEKSFEEKQVKFK